MVTQLVLWVFPFLPRPIPRLSFVWQCEMRCIAILMVQGKNWNLTLIRLNLIGHLGSLYIFGGLSKISQIGGLNDQVTTGVMLS